MKNAVRTIAALAFLLVLPGCDSLTGPETLGSFSWSEIEGDPVEDSSDFVAVGREVLLIGEFTTPTACYSLSPHLTESSTRLTLRIEARNNQTPNCAQEAGSYRYEAMLNRLDNGTYALVVIHDVQGGSRTEFVHDLVIGS